jgi:hypothetical protein
MATKKAPAKKAVHEVATLPIDLTAELPSAPKVVAAIQSAEEKGGTGHEKLGHALDIITETSGAIGAVSSDPKIAAIAKLISFTVTALNLFQSGVFKAPSK